MVIAPDKLKHFGAGVVTLMAAALVLYTYRSFGIGPAAALSTSLVGVAYELLQHYLRNGDPSPWDALATASPGWALWALISALHWVKS